MGKGLTFIIIFCFLSAMVFTSISYAEYSNDPRQMEKGASVNQRMEKESFEKFTMEHDYFTCYLPSHWKLEQDKAGDEETGIFEIDLLMTDNAKPEGDVESYFPEPHIYAGYYGKDNRRHKTFESYINDYETIVFNREGDGKSRYEKPKEIILNGKKAEELTYEAYLTIPRGSLAEVHYWLKAKFIVIKAKEGFYVLAYKSPTEFYDKYLSVFEEVARTFQTLY